MNYDSAKEWAKEKGYPFCEALVWPSREGYYWFLVSKDGKKWHLMSQIGFKRTVGVGVDIFGTVEDLKQACLLRER